MKDDLYPFIEAEGIQTHGSKILLSLESLRLVSEGLERRNSTERDHSVRNSRQSQATRRAFKTGWLENHLRNESGSCPASLNAA